MPKKAEAPEQQRREIPLPSQETGTVICVVEEMIGADHVKARCLDGVSRTCRIPGRFRRKVWLSVGDVILVSVWDFQPTKGDVIHRYEKAEVRELIQRGLLPEEFVK